jgi:serine protease AprX
MNRFTTATARAGLGLVAATLMALMGLGQQLPAPARASYPLVPVIVSAADSSAEQNAAHAVVRSGGSVSLPLGVIQGFAGMVPAWALAPLVQLPGVRSVTPNAPMHALGDNSNNVDSSYSPTSDVASLYNTAGITGARSMWSAGYTGSGVDIALIDTGITPVEGMTTPGKVVNGPDLSFDSQHANLIYLDGYGHGTHMAGIIAGRDGKAVTGKYATDTTNFLGIAPDARLVSVKVGDHTGAADVSQVIAGIDWVVQHRYDNHMNIRLINLSFGTDSTQSYINDPLAFAAEVAWKAGITVVTSAGNDGQSATGLADPAYDPTLLAVGAVDTNNALSRSKHTVAAFSDYGSKSRVPDVVAPGVHIASLRVPDSFIDSQFNPVIVGERFMRGSGTSQAAAVTTGAAALLLQQFPKATPDQLKALLMSSASRLQGVSNTSQGSGEIDLQAATAAIKLSTAAQSFAASTGTGSLELARGTHHLISDDVTLTGEKDIFGATFNTTDMARLEAAQIAWKGGVFNGNSWSGNSWSGNSWSGNSWSGNSWSGNSWSGNSWSGNSWSGNSWSGNSWSGNSWSGNSWSGNSWSGNSWSGNSWSGNSWSGNSWSGNSWSGNSWSGNSWSGNSWS